jgi:hypothetical protein
VIGWHVAENLACSLCSHAMTVRCRNAVIRSCISTQY